MSFLFASQNLYYFLSLIKNKNKKNKPCQLVPLIPNCTRASPGPVWMRVSMVRRQMGTDGGEQVGVGRGTR